jgi:hypothetical protein
MNRSIAELASDGRSGAFLLRGDDRHAGAVLLRGDDRRAGALLLRGVLGHSSFTATSNKRR